MTQSKESLQRYRQYLEDLAGTRRGRPEGFFGPGSMAWRVNREAALGLGGLRALLMQVAHPGVAQGVAEHSRYRQQPYQRAYSTLKAQQSIVFGDVAEAVDALLKMYARHMAVSGGTYRALNPHLQTWVWATLIDSALYAYQEFVAPLTEHDAERLYAESRVFGQLLDIPDELMPFSYAAFNAWMQEQMNGDVIRVSGTAEHIAAALLALPTRAARPLNRLWAAATLPDVLRRQYHLPEASRSWPHVARLIRRTVQALPAKWRIVPAYWRAFERCRRGAADEIARPR
ncbi:MAG: DUF2236 domain-containing protein [Chloroflexi bacterium]|nr:DUF2236 domain-containing protein [Chloroflexota bacterium]